MKIEDLTLPSGGKITFIDPDDVPAKLYREMRGSVRLGLSAAEMGQIMWPLAAMATIETWTLPYRPSGEVTTDAIDLLKIRDAKALEYHLKPFVDWYIYSSEIGDEGKEPAPEPGSEPAS